MDTLLSICLGLGLAAACGFRVFVPFLVLGAAARSGALTLGPGFSWIGETPALIAFSAATALEIAAYYVPWLDNLLDAAATPIAVVAGAVVSASAIAGIDPFVRWTLVAIAGGAVAGAVQGATVAARQLSSLTTGGLGNFVVATGEAVGSVVLAALAVLVPLLALAAVVLLLLGLWRVLRVRRRLAEAR